MRPRVRKIGGRWVVELKHPRARSRAFTTHRHAIAYAQHVARYGVSPW